MAEAQVLPSCPGCGQHVDRANLRCPRCRRWLVAPPEPPRWRRVARGVAVFVLVIGSFVGGMLLQWLWAPLPWGVVVAEVPVPADDGSSAAAR
jgi:uncharacterized paraquat-inducible protein A